MKLRTLINIAAFSTLTLTAIACGGTDPVADGGAGVMGQAGDSGTSGTPGSAGNGSGKATVDALINSICEYEFSCCDQGERNYRLGPFGDEAKNCSEQFLFQLNESNQSNNPFPSNLGISTVSGLLGALGYEVNLDRVTVNESGIAECIDSRKSLACSKLTEVKDYCEAGSFGSDPCALGNLFKPGLKIGDRCTESAFLTEGAANDVECPVGSSCLPASDPDNQQDFAACVQRGLADQPCTEDNDCDYNFYCNNSGRCTEKQAEGKSCSFNTADKPLPGEEDIQCAAGLSCNPSTLKCVSPCNTGFVCGAASAEGLCPESDSCAPATIGDNTDAFHICRALGNADTSRCDDDRDCSAARHCSAGTCLPDLAKDDPCGLSSECGAGLYCAAGSCQLLKEPNIPCVRGIETGCSPVSAPYCVFDSIAAATQCKASRSKAGDVCLLTEDCREGLICEATDTSGSLKCSVGAAVGDNCDADSTDSDKLDCGAGAWCHGGKCLAQQNPGGDCKSPDGDLAENNLCKNSSCTLNWDTRPIAPKYICTDAAIPLNNGGTALTCDAK